MKPQIRNNKDFWAGMMFFGTGAGAMFMARQYPLGTTLRMGPGYFPIALSGILILLGIYVMVRGLSRGENVQGNWSVRALILLPLSMVVFGVLMELAGFLPALLALIFMSAASGRGRVKLVENLLLTVCLGVLSLAIFIWGLGMPYQLIKIF